MPRVAAVALAVALTGIVGMMPPAAAECKEHRYLPLMDLIGFSTCDYNGELDQALEQLNQQLGGTIAVVVVKDKAFHPLQVSVKHGGTVLFLYADVEAKLSHDPRNGNLCVNAVDPVADPEACIPSKSPDVFSGLCFDIQNDLGDVMSSVGDVYPVTFRYAGGLVQASKGLLTGTLPVVGEPPFAAPFHDCVPNVGYAQPGAIVVPYHCRIHGANDAEGNADRMRGVLTIEAA